MKKRVVLSTWCLVCTLLALILLVVMAFIVPVASARWIVVGALVFMLLATLFYMPLYVIADDGCLCVRRPLRTRRIPFEEIQKAELYKPTMGEIRLCGSGGWFGYWGWFKEKPIGRYFAYYGKASDCFLVTLKSGKKYLLGCQDPASIVALLP